MPDRKFPEGTLPVAMCFLSVLIVLVIGATLLLRSCTQGSNPVNLTPTPQARASSTTQANSIASQSIKITIRRPSQAKTQKKTLSEAREGALNESPLYSDVKTGNNPTGGNKSKIDSLDQEQPQDEEIVIEMGQFTTSAASGSASASAIIPNQPSHVDNSPFGVMLTTAPDHVALDYRFLKLGQFGLDAEANLSQAGIGISAGEKYFINGGVFTPLHELKINTFIAIGARI